MRCGCARRVWASRIWTTVRRGRAAFCGGTPAPASWRRRTGRSWAPSWRHHAAVDVRRQRQGIGSALVARAMAALEQEGIHKVTLVVFARNRAGNAFWEKQGFALREDILIRDKSIHQMTRLDT